MEAMIRHETQADHRAVEEVTREAFWNLYVPGCVEHYLAHVMRDHADFMGELDYVALVDGRLVGNIMFTKSFVTNEAGARMDTITFGPLSVLPQFQRHGIGSLLIGRALRDARAAGHKAVIIYGNPKNYCRHGFRSCRDFGISTADGKYPYSLLVLELEQGVFGGHSWRFQESDAYNIDMGAVDGFDAAFEPKEKAFRHTQEEFRISCRAFIEPDA